MNTTALYRGKRNYELSNHLGNVQVVITDKRKSVCDEELGVEYFVAEELSAVDYYPFGMLSISDLDFANQSSLRNPERSVSEVSGMMPDRQWYANSDSSIAVNSFNGMRNDHEINGHGNSYTTEFRQYDSRVGRWFSTDPEYYRYYGKSPFVAFSDNPMIFIDPRGNTDFYSNKGEKIGSDNNPNGKKVIVLGRVNERQIRRDMRRNQKVISSNIQGAIPVVSNLVINKLEGIYTDIETNNTQEAGFVSGTNSDGKEIFTDAEPIPNKRALDMDRVITEQKGKGASVDIMAHGHPMHEEIDPADGHKKVGGFATPSEGDTEGAGRFEKDSPGLISIIVGYDLPTSNNPYARGDRTLNFYNNSDHNKPFESRGTKVNFNKYKEAVEKINKE